MRLFRHYTGLGGADRGAVFALGNFDGVHRGHQAVIAEVGRLARTKGAATGIITFEPHPRRVFKPEAPPFRLTSLRTKSHRLAALGVDLTVVLAFDRAFAAKTAETFVDEVLVAGLGVGHVVVGPNFRFGRDRMGTTNLLTELGRSHGFGVSVAAIQRTEAGIEYSSTAIRAHLAAGRPEAAAALLGSPWEIEGRVRPGDQRGRTIGFPTANIVLGELLRPATGVYAVSAGIDRAGATIWHDAVANFGRRPTVGGSDLLFETHLFDYASDLYGRHLRVQLHAFLRPERPFAGLDALKAQIELDSAEARRILARNP
ncbi:MAG: bifunctional riboflavin kinase/FAD synthetase [Alphaproteobacteria bacterium]|nr:bifunctional riboflavin kinase/FAD synthetase [Alphaproteobacteria bacterium]